MVALPLSSAPVASQRTRIATILSAGFVLATGICLTFAPHHLWLTYMSLAATTLLAAVAYTADPRPRPRGLRLVGNGRVLVRGLDEWTMYLYEVPFDRASSEQQSAALEQLLANSGVLRTPLPVCHALKFRARMASRVSLCDLRGERSAPHLGPATPLRDAPD